MIATEELIVNTLQNAEKVAIYTHINTDCDAIGSSLALKETLEILGKKCDLFINSTFPNNFKFYGDLSFVNQKTCDGYDVSVILDCPNESRLGRYKYSYRKGVKKTIMIDHHFSIFEKFCDLNYVRQISSTAELLFGIIEKFKIRFTETICRNLISGIITDTGKFAHSTTKNTFYVVSKLLGYSNLDMSDIYEKLLNSMPFSTFLMLKLYYQKIEFFADNQCAIVTFNRKDFEDCGASLNDLDAFPDLPLQIESVKFAILSSEDDKGYFRTSFRSKAGYSARAVAEVFGGSGHFNASGCKIFGEEAEVKQKLIDATKNCFDWGK